MIRVSVPATSANLGAGFDCLGLALQLENEVRITPAEQLEIILQPQDIGCIPTDEKNLLYRTIANTFDVAGQKCPPLRIEQYNNIPFTRGLGSSAACVVAGIKAANLLLDNPLSDQEMLDMAAKADGHADNVAAAMMGGLVTSTIQDEHVYYVKEVPHPKFNFHILLPDFELSTRHARSVLPDMISHQDAVFNLTRSTMMFASLVQGNQDNLVVACQDRLHQPYRMSLVPGMDAVMGMAYDQGACAAWLSGAGPCIAAVTIQDADGFTRRMGSLLDALDTNWSILQLDINTTGVKAHLI